MLEFLKKDYVNLMNLFCSKRLTNFYPLQVFTDPNEELDVSWDALHHVLLDVYQHVVCLLYHHPHQVHQDQSDQLDNQDHKDQTVPQGQQDQPDHQDFQDHQGHQDYLNHHHFLAQNNVTLFVHLLVQTTVVHPRHLHHHHHVHLSAL